MHWWVCLAASLVVLPVVAEETASTQGGQGLAVQQAAICTGVVDRTPAGAAEVFEAGVGKLWCFTRIVGIPADTTITHVWYKGDQKVHEQQLTIHAPAWRTWSNKTIPPEWKGAWHVDVVGADGSVLTTLRFNIE